MPIPRPTMAPWVATKELTSVVSTDAKNTPKATRPEAIEHATALPDLFINMDPMCSPIISLHTIMGIVRSVVGC